MAKLNPPILEGKLPAQHRLDSWYIPFTHNPAVGPNDYIGMAIKIKDVVSNAVLHENIHFSIPSQTIFAAQFDQNGFGNKVGSYYKVQLAYVSGSEENPIVGYYSSIGVVKQTVIPTITISSTQNLNLFKEITIECNFIGDSTEKVLNYQLDFYKADELWLSSGELLNSYGATTLKYTINKVLRNTGGVGKLKIGITTTNGLQYTYETDVSFTHARPAGSNCRFVNNFDTGGVDIYALPDNDPQGMYLISKKNKDDTYVKLCTYRGGISKDIVAYKDLSIEQGDVCEYVVQALDENIKPSIYMDFYTVNFVDFEDMFLFDGEKQLKIRFDPKVASFKTTILESKTDTIGGRYPVFFRNGHTAYKEFSISGLISYELDNEEMFIPKEKLGLTSNIAKRTSTVSDDTDFANMTAGQRIAAERRFKLAVLDWLNDGKPKLFRSPTEGNYYVRLMNVSLSPNDTLGRMIHTFNCTAYEVGDQAPFCGIEGVGLLE